MIARIKEFICKLFSIKVFAFIGVFVFSAIMLIRHNISGGEYVALTLGLYGMLIGAREYSKQQYRAFDYAMKSGTEEPEPERVCGFRGEGEK